MTKSKSRLQVGRLLVAVYGVLAFAAIGRSGYELVAKFDQAPVVYSLSLFSALVYLAATFTLGKNTATSRRIALAAVWIELIGVITIGGASVLVPAWFTVDGVMLRTVWSFFGIGYGFVPLVLPFFGLAWLRKKA